MRGKTSTTSGCPSGGMLRFPFESLLSFGTDKIIAGGTLTIRAEEARKTCSARMAAPAAIHVCLVFAQDTVRAIFRYSSSPFAGVFALRTHRFLARRASAVGVDAAGTSHWAPVALRAAAIYIRLVAADDSVEAELGHRPVRAARIEQ